LIQRSWASEKRRPIIKLAGSVQMLFLCGDSFWVDKPIGASPRGGWTVLLGLLGLLCCDHDDCVFPYNGSGNSMSIYLRNPSASLKWLSCLWMFTNGFYWSVALVCNFGGFVSFLAGLFHFGGNRHT
jgi:hypothetical protein